MAFDRTPNTSVLDPATVTELRASLARSLAAGSHEDDLKPLLARAAAEARAKGIQAEQLLLALKDIWYSLPAVRGMRDPTEQIRLLQRVVTVCIKEYYGD